MLRFTFATICLLPIAGCAHGDTVAIQPCEASEVDSEMEATRADAQLTLKLPKGSSLVDENTEDARYWTWRTSIGNLSIAWIGRIAREHYWEKSVAGSCLFSTSEGSFLVSHREGEIRAISAQRMKNGAGLLVTAETQELPSENRTFRSILASIVVEK